MTENDQSPNACQSSKIKVNVLFSKLIHIWVGQILGKDGWKIWSKREKYLIFFRAFEGNTTKNL